MADNVATIRAFCAAWSRLDVDELLGYFAEDGIYHNMPMGPVQGHAALRPFIAGFLSGWSKTEWEIRSIVGSDDVVIAERVDRTVVGDKPVDLPCCGVFELKDGKIAAWRDYFDLGTYTRALGG
jgi:limonene-1,2-epoxide hydrolase